MNYGKSATMRRIRKFDSKGTKIKSKVKVLFCKFFPIMIQHTLTLHFGFILFLLYHPNFFISQHILTAALLYRNKKYG